MMDGQKNVATRMHSSLSSSPASNNDDAGVPGSTMMIPAATAMTTPVSRSGMMFPNRGVEGSLSMPLSRSDPLCSPQAPYSSHPLSYSGGGGGAAVAVAVSATPARKAAHSSMKTPFVSPPGAGATSGVGDAHYYTPGSGRDGAYSYGGSQRVPWTSPLANATTIIDATSPDTSVDDDLSDIPFHANKLTVRVLSAETRRDLAGKKYTTYVMRVRHPKTENGGDEDAKQQSFPSQIEHRYSEFAKLNKLIQSYRVHIGLAFPSKHWAGRVGNWTPALQWAPDQHAELIQNRKVQLDFWMVHVVEKLNRGELPQGVVNAVYEFLTISDKPPCDQENATSKSWKWNNPVSFTLGSSVRQATAIVEHMCLGYSKLGTAITKTTDRSIPLDLLHHAKGLCFLTVVKAGLVVSGRVGTGLLVARLPGDRWSAPCAMGTMGMGYGMLAGGDITHYLVVLTTMEAVQSLVQGTGVQLGAELGVAVGPVGRGATSQVSASNDNTWTVHAAYSYAHSKGLFVGVSLEGSILAARHEVNAKFYGRRITPEEVLDQASPKAAEPLYSALRLALAQNIPVDAFRPSLMFHGSDADFDVEEGNLQDPHEEQPQPQQQHHATILSSPDSALISETARS